MSAVELFKTIMNILQRIRCFATNKLIGNHMNALCIYIRIFLVLGTVFIYNIRLRIRSYSSVLLDCTETRE